MSTKVQNIEPRLKPSPSSTNFSDSSGNTNTERVSADTRGDVEIMSRFPGKDNEGRRQRDTEALPDTHGSKIAEISQFEQQQKPSPF